MDKGFPAPYINDRAELGLAMASLIERGIIDKDTVVTPSYLRIKQTLDNSTSNYEFDITSASGTAPDELKLSINDSFFCTHFGFYLVPENTGDPLNIPYQTYPNQVAFVNTGNPADLEAVYKGSFSVKVQSTTVYEKIDLQRFRIAPQTQQAGATDVSQQDALQGLQNLTPNLFLNGRATNSIVATLPTGGSVQWAGTTTWQNKLVLVAYGFLIKNVSFTKEG